MKKIVLVTVLLVLIGGIVYSADVPMPNDLQIVPPDPSLPKELIAFSGKWEAIYHSRNLVIVEKIDEEKASLYCWDSSVGWQKYDAKVTKERGKYKLWFRGRRGGNEFSLKGERLEWYQFPSSGAIFTRMP